ncbi:restriction endonuclease subunit S [Algoriphagus sp. Y33]|uniref:methylation-associated defense system restriction endonuclease subunit S MAD5 n=1 Tax=Algoriphagus sp. Y33 TaxID=2772483 RepID=UPI00177E3DA6|nr:restriction endonuclease subunit S [Algoriphagus sp. Y33]
MKVLKVKSSWLSESDLRLDAPFHLSDGVKTKRLIEKFCPYELTTIEDESLNLYKGNIHKRVYVSSPEHGYMFYTASDLFKADLETGKYVSKRYSSYLKELELKRNWILITRSGTLGKVLLTSEDHEKKIGTDDLVRVYLKQEKVKTGYLYAFLSSKYGYGLLTQAGYGGVVKHIEPDHVKGINVPVLPITLQDRINTLITESSHLRVEANKLLKEATRDVEQRVLKELGRIKKEPSSSRNIKELFQYEKRLDAPYNWSLGRLINDEIIKIDHKLLSELSEVFHPILFGKKQIKGTPTKGNPLYKSTSMGKLKPETDFWLSLKKNDSYRKLQVKEGWVLISRTGTVGNVVRINKSMNNTFIDDHMIRVKPSSNYHGLVYIFLKSYYGQKLIEFQKYGSVQEVINSTYIERIPIPATLMDKNFLSELDQKVKTLSDFFDTAYLKETEAIELVENEIESWQKS